MSILKNKVSRTQYLASLREQMRETANPKAGAFKKKDDERFWKPEVDKTGNGSAVIRFLPQPEGEPIPYIQLHSHGFQGPSGKWFIESCPTTLNQECPACKANSALWKTGIEADKKLASSRKRKLNYISNILVVNDPKHPENNGKVFLFKFGKKIFEKIKDLADPPAEFDQEPVNAYCPTEGANFMLRITRQDGFPNYDKSSFGPSTALFNGNEDKIAALESQLHSLQGLLDPKEFKSGEDLKKRLDLVLDEPTEDAPAPRQSKPSLDQDEAPVAPPRPARTAEAKPVGRVAKPKIDEDEDEEDFFANLARTDDED